MTDERRVKIGENDWRNMLITELKRTGGDPSHLFEILEEIIKQRAWEDLRDDNGNPVGSLRRLIEAPPPIGCGQPADKVVRLLAIEHRYEKANEEWAERMRVLREAIQTELDLEIEPMNEVGTNQYTEGGTCNTPEQRGNTREYALAKLESDHPELAQRVRNKELSANAAAIQAGIRNPTMTVFLDDMEKNAKKLLHYLEPDQVAELIDLLYKYLEDEHG